MHYALILATVVTITSDGGADGASPDNMQRASIEREFTQESERPLGFKWGYSVFLLANERNVQAELRMTPEQTLAIAGLASEYLDSLRAFAEKNREPADVKRSPAKASLMHEKTKAFLAKYGNSAINVLSKEQQQRLEQVAFQLCGFEVLRYREVMEALTLTDVQKSQITDLRSWLISECEKVKADYAQKRLAVAGFNEGTDKALAEAKERAIATFTPEQREVFESMEGPKISFARRHLKMEIRKARTTPGSGIKRDE